MFGWLRRMTEPEPERKPREIDMAIEYQIVRSHSETSGRVWVEAWVYPKGEPKPIVGNWALLYAATEIEDDPSQIPAILEMVADNYSRNIAAVRRVAPRVG